MRLPLRRLRPLALASFLLGAPLGACGIPGGGGFEGVLVVTPSHQVVDLPSEGEARVPVVLTFRNIGLGSTGIVNTDLTFDTDAVHVQNPGGTCPQLNPELDPGESCTYTLELVTPEPPSPSDVTVRVFGNDSGDATGVITVQ
jgi:hypothetical protein